MTKTYTFQQFFFTLLWIAHVNDAYTATFMFLTDSRHAVNSRSIPYIPHAPAMPIVNTTTLPAVAAVHVADLNITGLNPAVVLITAPHLLSHPEQINTISPDAMPIPVSIPLQTCAIPETNIIQNITDTIKRRTRPESAQYDTDPSSILNTLDPHGQLLPLKCTAYPYDQLKSIYRGTILRPPLKIFIHQSATLPMIMTGVPVIVIGGVGTAPIITIPTVAIGAGLAIKWIVGAIKNKINGIKATKEQSSGGGGGNNPNDPDDKNKKENSNKFEPVKHPNGEYENNPKHHQNSKGDIGKPPRDGQAALDSSIEVPGKERARVTIEDKKFVMLKQHSPGKWHGYIVENFKNLPQKAQNVLSKAGRCDHKSGRIIK